MSKAKELDDKAKAYILDCIDGSGYGVEINTETGKLRFLHDTFMNEVGKWRIPQGVPERKAFIDWMQGLPSCFNIEFENYRILELARKWGSLSENSTSRQEDRILENYWNFIMNKTYQLFSKYNICK